MKLRLDIRGSDNRGTNNTALAGIALVQQSVEFVKKNIETVQDIGQIIDVVDNTGRSTTHKQTTMGKQECSRSTQTVRTRCHRC